MDIENVILVDENDKQLGTMEKLAAHQRGRLHRAFSVFVFNRRGELLLQQRALNKYHSAGKWSNTCCSHPRPGEGNEAGASRRLSEEMGLQCDLVYGFNFTYRAALEHGLTECEIDHVFFGTTDALPVPNPEEVAAYAYISPEVLTTRLKQNPEHYSEWFKICFEQVMEHYYYQNQEHE